jgi:transcriptional regulator with XRE-family HTH domain
MNSMALKKPRTPKKPKAPNNPRAPKAVDIFVGSRIRLWRMRREMTQEQLGKILKVAYQQIQKYEKGVNRVAAARLNDFANALDVPVSEFFVGAKDAERRSIASPRAAFDPQAFRIAEAFARITDEQIRRFLLRFTETMARKFGDSTQQMGSAPKRIIGRSGRGTP